MTAPAGVEVIPAALSDKVVLRQLFQLYHYDFGEILGRGDLNEHGFYDYTMHLDHYWTEPERYPFLIKLDGKWVGFVLVSKETYFPEREPGWVIAEFFVMRRYRRRGVGEYAARFAFDRFPGRWEVAQVPENTGAVAFWRKVIGRYTGGRFEETYLENDRWTGTVQSFANSELERR